MSRSQRIRPRLCLVLLASWHSLIVKKRNRALADSGIAKGGLSVQAKHATNRDHLNGEPDGIRQK